MRHVEHGAQHIADAVAGAHRNARRQRSHRKPGADLAIHPGIEVARVRLHPRQRLGQHRQSLQRLGVGVGMRLARAQAFDAMVDGADAGRQPQPLRRVQGHGGIEDGGAGHHELVAHRFLDLAANIGDAGDRAEFAAGDGGGHADLAHRRGLQRWCCALRGADRIDGLDAANIVGETELHRLGAVGDRAAADGDDEIGLRAARLLGGGDDGLARGMRRHRVERCHATRPQTVADLVDLVGASIERAADHQEGPACAQAVHLRGDGVGGRAAENHLVHGAEYDTPAVHGDHPPGTLWPYRGLAANLAEQPAIWEP